jgi:S1-C subfamily serine protease
MSFYDQDPLPGLGPEPRPPRRRRARAPRPVLAGLLVAALSAAAGAAIAHEAWSGNTSNSSSQQASSGLFGQPSPSQSGGSSSSGASAASQTSSVAAKVDHAVVDINTTLAGGAGQAAGTGMVVTPSGEILTNNHVISEAVRITATDVGNGRTYTAHVVGYDTSKDVAVLQLDGASGLATVNFGDSRKVKVGQSVTTIGNAGGVGGTPTAAAGSVVALGQSITAQDSAGGAATIEQLTGLIEIDGQLEPGDSGGPLVDSSAHVVGMDTAASTNFTFQSSNGEGFAIPIDTALAIARQIEAGKGSGTIHIGATALIGVDITSNVPQGCGFSNASAVWVAGVVNGGAAAAAGIQPCDTITALGGHAVGSPSSLVAAKDRFHPGDRVKITWSDTNGTSHTATIRLTGGPPD